MARHALNVCLLSNNIQICHFRRPFMLEVLMSIRSTHNHVVTIYSDRHTHALSRSGEKRSGIAAPSSNSTTRIGYWNLLSTNFPGMPVCFPPACPVLLTNLTFDSSIGLYGRTYTTHHLLGGLTSISRWSAYI